MTKNSAIYDALASIYELWLSGDADAEPCYRFYTSLPYNRGDRVLELGVGTGRIACALADLGFEVVGIDASLEMLARVPPRCNSDMLTPKLVHGLFKDMPLDSSTFDWVICPMRTIGHLITPAQRFGTFREVHRVLKPGGLFVFDHYRFNRRWAEAHDGQMRLMYEGPTTSGAWQSVRIWDKYDYFYSQKTLHCTVTIEHVGASGRVETKRTVEFDFCWFDSADIANLAAKTGFEVVDEHDDFDWQNPKRTAGDLILILRNAR